MSIMARPIIKPSVRSCAHWGRCLVSLVLITPLVALADQPADVNGVLTSSPIQTSAIDPITGLHYAAPLSVNGVAMTVDAEGHPRAFCADPADSLAPAVMRDLIEPATSRVRYE
ncbi:MAG: hypothetical protein ABIR27_07295 [Dokdonella sp.]